MNSNMYLWAVCCILAYSVFPTASSYNLVCYFSSWAIYRPSNGKFDVANIDPNLCTHINFAFVELLQDGTLYIIDPWESNSPSEGGHYDGFRHLKGLKDSNPELKILVSLGGWNEGTSNFSKVAANPAARQKLVTMSLDLVQKYGFDGFDIDWEYPTLRDDAQPEDKENFVALLKDYYAVFSPKGLLLTAAVAGAVDKIESAYEVEQISQYLDMINVMTYDYHGAFDNFVGHIAPLHASPLDYEHGRNSTYVVATGFEYWLYKGAPASKLNLGVATYARTFTLEDKTNTDLYAPVAGAGKAGPYSNLTGTLSYNEVCSYYSGDDSTYIWDDDQKVPHRVVGDQWIGFEDTKSIQLKTDFAIAKGAGGIMVWVLDSDDFLGSCGTKYTLVNTVKNRLINAEKQNTID